jgi:hypothetical protein
MYILKKIIIISFILYSSISIFSDYTYFDYDKLVFGNAGGIEIVPTYDVNGDEDGYILQILNISGSDAEYISKGFSAEGKILSIIPTTGNAYSQSDTMEMGNTDTFELATVPQVDASNFPTDRILLVGEYYGNFMLFDEDTIAGYIISTSNSYEPAPIYFQEEYGNFYMGKTIENLPVLSIYPSLDSKAYVGINTTAPVAMLSVSGNLRVDGVLITTEPLGLMDADLTVDNSNNFNSTDETAIVVNEIFTIPGPLPYNVMIMGTSQSSDNDFGPTMTSYFDISYLNSNNVWETYTDPNESTTVAIQSKRKVDGGPTMGSFPLNPFISIQLNPNDDGTARDYLVEFVVNIENYDTGSTYDLTNAKILIIGLPTGSLGSVPTTLSPASTQEITTINSTSFSELDGNYLTNQLISFGSGGGVAESGDSLIFTTGDDYMNFRASSLEFGEYHSIDTLKIINPATGYHFQVGSDTADNLGINVAGTFYGGIVTQNIQTLQSGSSVKDTDLTFESDVYVADTFKVLTNGSVIPNVEIGDVISDSSVMLNVEDDLLFTGTYTGTGILIAYEDIDAGNYSTGYFNGRGDARNANDVITMPLPSGTNWDVSIYCTVTTYLKGRPNHNNLRIGYSDGTTTTYSSQVQVYIDHNVQDNAALVNFHQVNLEGGETYEFFMSLLNDDFDSTAALTNIAINHDDFGGFESVINIPIERGNIAVIAVPSNQ